ncbi:MAG: cupin domain-containing protein [Lachnospiraceae bacterium]|nr:cupin domain-containing protein [Lachnospiraceae bacterium]
MNIILLSEESGKRLWPLSNGVRSKQFLKLLKTQDGGYESMIQRTVKQIKKQYQDVKITVVTGRAQVSAVINQLGESVFVCDTPGKKGKFWQIGLAASYLADKRKTDPSETVIVCPADLFVEDEFFCVLEKLCQKSGEADEFPILTGVVPTYPSEKYGYLLPVKENQYIYRDRPDEKTALRYMDEGALWNSGVFGAKLEWFLKLSHKYWDFYDFEDLYNDFAKLPEISWEKQVLEGKETLQAVGVLGSWRKLGTWNTLTESMEDAFIGNVIMDQKCENIHVINELDMPVLCMGLSDVVVSVGPQGILISDKQNSSYIEPFVDQIDEKVMIAEKSWGSYRVLDVEEESMTIKVTLNPGHSMNYHSHERRDEVWNIIGGKGRIIVDGMEQPVCAGDVITMQAGCRHTIIAETELNVIEVQLGREINVEDKKKYELEI